MKKIYITGISGTGKSAIIEEFIKREIFAFSIEGEEDLCDWIDKKTGVVDNDRSPNIEWLRSHDWRLDIERLKKVFEREKSRDLLIATGITSNQDDYLNLFDKIFLLQCSEETCLERITVRHLHGGNKFGKYRHERDFVVENFKDFNQKMLDRGAIAINAEQYLDKVVDDIISKL